MGDCGGFDCASGDEAGDFGAAGGESGVTIAQVQAPADCARDVGYGAMDGSMLEEQDAAFWDGTTDGFGVG